MKVITSAKAFFKDMEHQTRPLILFGAFEFTVQLLDILEKAGVYVDAVYDIDPRKQNRYLNTKHRILRTEELRQYGGQYDIFFCDTTVLRFFDTNYRERYGSYLEVFKADHREFYAKVKMKYLLEDALDGKQEIRLSPYFCSDGNLYLFRELETNDFLRFFRARQLPSSRFTLLSNNGTAGTFYRWLNRPPASPTVGTRMHPDDFIKFCRNLRYYADLPLRYVKNLYSPAAKSSYPLALLGDLEVHLTAARSFEQAKARWMNGIRSIAYDALYLVLDEFPDALSEKNIRDFLTLPSANKIVFSEKFARFPDIVLRSPRHNALNASEPVEAWFDLTGWINGARPARAADAYAAAPFQPHPARSAVEGGAAAQPIKDYAACPIPDGEGLRMRYARRASTSRYPHSPDAYRGLQPVQDADGCCRENTD